jgi:hypothetical protein
MGLTNAFPQTASKQSTVVEKRPDFFIVGAPKCGTTALAEYLSRHPNIFMARKEMHYFGRDLEFGAQIYRRDRAEYLKEFAAGGERARAGEASVWNLYSTQAAAEIKAFNPRARIIIMIREPVEMIYSLYHQFRVDGNEHLPTFEQALAAQEDRRAGRRVTRHTYFRKGLLYMETARFTEQIRRYFKIFGREQVQVVVYDDFASETSAMYARVLDFLGVEAVSNPGPFPVINGSQVVRLRFLRNLLSDPLVRGTLVATHSWMPARLFSAMQTVESWFMQYNSRPARRAPMEAELRRRLQREFAPEVERLSQLLGRDLTAWSRSESARTLAAGHPAAGAEEASDSPSFARRDPSQTTPVDTRPVEAALRSNS